MNTAFAGQVEQIHGERALRSELNGNEVGIGIHLSREQRQHRCTPCVGKLVGIFVAVQPGASQLFCGPRRALQVGLQNVMRSPLALSWNAKPQSVRITQLWRLGALGTSLTVHAHLGGRPDGPRTRVGLAMDEPGTEARDSRIGARPDTERGAAQLGGCYFIHGHLAISCSHEKQERYRSLLGMTMHPRSPCSIIFVDVRQIHKAEARVIQVLHTERGAIKDSPAPSTKAICI
mmetsp:Transcript_12060/g.38550  ORF Transcript_12060/g.38550 Transcript_12060/m.38550 type:complete len:233 (-) Transcript_12060:30-728(-)